MTGRPSQIGHEVACLLIQTAFNPLGLNSYYVDLCYKPKTVFQILEFRYLSTEGLLCNININNNKLLSQSSAGA